MGGHHIRKRIREAASQYEATARGLGEGAQQLSGFAPLSLDPEP